MFLPDNYTAPKSSSEGYMKLQDGENRFRILSQPILGWEDWTLEKKPVRFRYNNKPSKSIIADRPVRHFWAMIVWNYTEEKIQILQISQATIRKTLEKLCKDADWGAPYFYDIKIIKEGESKDTEYSISPVPGKPLHPMIIDAFKESPIYLDALFDNADPFAKEWHEYTKGIFSRDDISKVVPIKKEAISLDDVNELKCLLDMCEPTYKESVWNNLQKNGIADLADLSIEMFDRVKKAAIKKSEEYKNAELPF